MKSWVYDRYPKGYPDTDEIKRALDFTGWAYEGGYDTAEEIYAEIYGTLPCLAMEPDGGLLMALDCLHEAVGQLEDLEK